jgi:transcriptional regulator with XRE-family HTH domain
LRDLRAQAQRSGAGALLIAARNDLELTAKDIAETFRVDQRTVTRWEATADPAKIDPLVWIAYYCLLRSQQADPTLINALPVPSRRVCPAIRQRRRAAG